MSKADGTSKLIVLTGRVVGDATVADSASGKKFVKFSLAFGKDADTEYYDVIASDAFINVAPYVTKGRLIQVVGKPSYKKKNKPDGTAYKELTVFADGITLLSNGNGNGAKAEGDAADAAPAAPATKPKASKPAPAPAPEPEEDPFDEDPFA